MTSDFVSPPETHQTNFFSLEFSPFQEKGNRNVTPASSVSRETERSAQSGPSHYVTMMERRWDEQ